MTMLLRILAIFICLAPITSAQNPNSAESALDNAIATMRNIPQTGLSDEQMDAKAKQLDKAWNALIAAGPAGTERLKKEIAKLDAGKEKDDVFKLGATALLWEIGKTAEADYIAGVWNSTPIAAQYRYVFYTAFAAAQTQDPRVLPMLKALLRDSEGSIFVGAHSMTVRWPLSLEFIWGAYGPAGLTVLAEVLEKSTHDVESMSAMNLLAEAQYLPSIARIRQLTESKSVAVRLQAVRSLGHFGHPDDFERFIAGTNTNDPGEIFSYAYALYEFEDERAVPHLIPLLAKGVDQSRVEVALALLHLLTPESLAAVKKYVANSTNKELTEFLTRSIARREEKLPKGYEKLPRDKQAKLMDQVRNAEVTPAGTAKPFTNAQLVAAMKVWKEKGRIYNSGAEWPGDAEAIAAARADNIEELQATKARFYRRLSDECLYETRDIDRVVKYAGRSRYRRGIGVTAKAELR